MSGGDRFDLSDDGAFERLLREALDREGRPAPFPVDVTGAVMARVAAYGPVAEREVGPAQLRFWGATAAALAVVLVAMALSSAPTPGDLVNAVGGGLGAATAAAARLGLAAAALVDALGHAVLALLEGGRAVAAPLAPAAPIATAILSGAAAAVLGFAALIAGRDLIARGARKENA